VIAHVPEGLGQGDAGIDGGFPGRDRHVAGVGDEYGALHQGVAGAGVDEVGEFGQDARHFVAPLAAAHVNDQVRGTPLGELVLGDGLPRAEAPGDGRSAALGQGEEGVHDALAGDEGFGGEEALPVRADPAHGPAVPEVEGNFIALVRTYPGDDVG